VTPTLSNIEWAHDSSGAIVSSEFTAESLAEALGALCASSDLWSQISEATRKWCQEFGSWENSERKLVDVYKSIEVEKFI
jgi:hypothetical protein